MNAAITPDQTLMVRQPIFGPDLKIAAYELLYDANAVSDEALIDPDRATSEILLNTFTSLFQDGSMRRVPLMIELSHQLLLKGATPQLPPEQVILQIPPEIRLGPQVLAHIQQLSQQGYRLTLRGFALQRHLIPLVKYMSIIQIDVASLPPAKLHKLVALLQRSRAKLLARQIRTLAELQSARKLGFALFQGPFISRPVTVKGRKLPGNSVALLRLIQELSKPSVSAEAVESLITLDPVLTYKMLRVVNSAAYNLPRKIESVRQALVLLGLDQVRKWATLIALGCQEGRPEELSRNLLVRGRLCQLLGEQCGDLNPEACFMVGVLSQLDALMGMEMEELLKQIPLDDEISAAIGSFGGPLGELLRTVVHHEQGDWDALKALGLHVGFIEAAYRHSLSWAQGAMRTLTEH